jgi:tetratricopeptide (TPR) repeat protein
VEIVVTAPWLRSLTGVLLILARTAAAQLPEAEDAFERGDYRTARALYDSVLTRDSLNPRALYRLAVLDSWDGNLKQSLARFVRLRGVEQSLDIAVAHAKVLAWDGQTRWSEALYDSVLAIDSARSDALAGRARAVAWSGDLDRAERLWRAALERYPDDAEILIGLAQTLYWEGQPGLAEGYVARARALAPANATARDLFDQLRAERRPVLAVASDGASDIEHNRFVSLAGTFSASLIPALRSSLRASWRRNDLGGLVGTSSGFEAWVVQSFPGGSTLRVGAGARALNWDTGTRTFVTFQAGIGLRPAKFSSISMAYARYPFDETALLVRRAFVWNELDVSAEFAPGPGVDITVVGNAAWLSDGNRRLIGATSFMVGVTGGLQAGAYARIMGYREANPGRDYFAPDRFTVGEGRVAYAWRRQRWAARLGGGLGAQQVGTSGATQVEWHGDVTLSRSWRALDELALVAVYTNSATARSGAEVTPTYRYWSVGIRMRRGF